MQTIKVYWRPVLAVLPLPMLALAASYGVYSFALLFVPFWVAVVQAAAFELTYIGLAVLLGLTDQQRQRAGLISLGAVVVSILYNSLAGFFHREPELLASLPWWGEAVLAVLHGLPLALVAYFVADLLLHRGVEAAPAAPLAWPGPVVAQPASYARELPPQPTYPAPVQVRAADATKASVKATKPLVCPACSATLTTGEYGAARRWGRCKHCKGE